MRLTFHDFVSVHISIRSPSIAAHSGVGTPEPSFLKVVNRTYFAAPISLSVAVMTASVRATRR